MTTPARLLRRVFESPPRPSTALRQRKDGNAPSGTRWPDGSASCERTGRPGDLTDIDAFLDAVEGRELAVHLTVSDQRRLRDHIADLNREFVRLGEEPMDSDSDLDLAMMLVACADRGLHASEIDRGVYADPAGYIHPLPRRNRARRRDRARYALRDAISTWRAS